ILLAAAASVVLLLLRASRPHVAFLGRIPGTRIYSDSERHPDNEPIPGVIAFRPESSLMYVNVETVFETVLDRIKAAKPQEIKLVVCDLSASPYIDLAGSRMLHKLHAELSQHQIPLRIIGARGRVRDMLRADAFDDKVEGLRRDQTFDDLLESLTPYPLQSRP